jgi:hypothetical protein
VTFFKPGEQHCLHKGTAAYLLLSLMEIKEDEFVVGEVSFGKSQADTRGVRRGRRAVENEGWHLRGV